MIAFTVKASFYRMARIYHPDRVDESDKTISKEKFTIIHRAYKILVDPESKKCYDAGELKLSSVKTTIAGTWEKYIRTVEPSDIIDARMKYQGSSLEEKDVIREFVIGNGSMTHLLNVIPFMRYEDELRIIEIVKRSMNAGKTPKIAIRKLRK